jgi:accessory gene regulator protein AgrB
MLKLKNLSASDFPGVDEAKFKEWKRLKMKFNNNPIPIVWIALLVAQVFVKNLALFILFAIITAATIVYAIVGSQRYRKLGRELDMGRRVRALARGKEYKG